MCATFAYFTASVQGNDSASSVVVKTAKIGTITYENGNTVNLKDALPGATDTKTFTVASDGDTTADITYGLSWKDVTNDFETKTDLVYKIEGQATSGTAINVPETTCPDTAGAITGTATLKPGETHTYKLTVTFKETYSDQNSNQEKTFNGTIQVNTGDADEIYFNSTYPSGTTTKPSSEG